MHRYGCKSRNRHPLAECCIPFRGRCGVGGAERVQGLHATHRSAPSVARRQNAAFSNRERTAWLLRIATLVGDVATRRSAAPRRAEHAMRSTAGAVWRGRSQVAGRRWQRPHRRTPPWPTWVTWVTQRALSSTAWLASVPRPALMQSRRTSHWLAAAVVLLHVLAPGVHALQLRVEQQRGEVVRSCCMAGNQLGGGDRREPTRLDLHGARLIDCAVGSLILIGHGYLPRVVRAPSIRASKPGFATVVALAQERNRQPETAPARAPPA